MTVLSRQPLRSYMLSGKQAGVTPGMSQEIEAAIAREQERLARLLEMTRSGKMPAETMARETIPELLAQIREAIDQIEILVGEEIATRT